MGQRPSTAKDSEDGEALLLGLGWGASSMQGERKEMEDAHLAIPSLAHHDPKALLAPLASGWSRTALFGVLDGHGGAQVAKFCKTHLPEELVRRPSDQPAGALAATFLRLDEMLTEGRSLMELDALGAARRFSCGVGDTGAHGCGTTACVCCIRHDSIITANAGDSRAVLCRNGIAIDLSQDHKPGLAAEASRIQAAGGYVDAAEGRVNGDLAVSRAIGDLDFKGNPSFPPEQQVVSAEPDVQVVPRQPGDEFLVIACDGVWDVMSSQDAVDFIRERLASSPGIPLSEVAEDLLDHSLAIGSTDNMTVVLVSFEEPPAPGLHGPMGPGLSRGFPGPPPSFGPLASPRPPSFLLGPPPAPAPWRSGW